jgi:hypothetical protein
MAARKKKTATKNPARVANMNANRLVTVRLTMRHYVNGVAYGPGEVKVPANLAAGMAHTEGTAIEVEEQFRGTKAAIIGPRRSGGFSIKEVPGETFDTEWTNPNAVPADTVRGSQYGSDPGSGRPI